MFADFYKQLNNKKYEPFPWQLMLFRKLCRFSSLCHYETLKVGRSATHHDIKVAYRKLAKQHHPDIGKTKESEVPTRQTQEMFKQINIAYETLKDTNKRRLYDLSLINSSFSETSMDAEHSQSNTVKQDYYNNKWYQNKKPMYSNLRDDYYHYSHSTE